MSEQNIVNVMVIPDVPKVLPGEQLYVYVPKASFTSPGIIAYNSEQFEINGNFLRIRDDYVSSGVKQKIAELKEYTDGKLQLKQDKEDSNINLSKNPEQKTVVGAINELGQYCDEIVGKIGDFAALTTDEKGTVVGAINEVDKHTDNAQQSADNATTLANTGISKAEQAQSTANTAVDKANDAKATAEEAIMKADGRSNSIGFMTAKDAVTALNGYPRNQLKGGDTIWIVETGTPDLWVTEVAENSVPYNYTTKDKFNQDLVDNKVLQIGYFKTAYQESDGKPVTIAWQNVKIKTSDWVASTEFEDFPYEAKIELTDFVDYMTVPQVVFDIADTMSGNYAPICKSGDKCVYIYGKTQDEITLKTVITFAPNVNGASVTGGGYNNRGKWVASTTYAIDDLVYTDNGQYVCIEGITSTTSPEQDTTHWQATFVATGKTKNGLTISGQDNGTEVQKTFDGSQAVEIAFDENTMTAKEVNGVLKVGAKGTVPEALPQEASALKSGNLPTSGWGQVAAPFWEGELHVGTSLTEVAPAGTVPEALRQDTSLSNWSVKYAAVGWVQPYSTPSIEGANLKIPYSGTQNMYVYPDGSIYAQSVGLTYTYYGIKNKTYGKQTYTISDTSITANSDILMELTDEGGVKAYSMEAGKITVIRDTVPTQPIPYTYKVKQTNASGQFTLVNHFVPKVPEVPTSLPVTYKKVSGELPTTGWESTNVSWTGNVTSPANYNYLRFVTNIAGSYATNEIFYKTTYDNLLKSATVTSTGSGPIGNAGSSAASTQTGDYKLYAEESNAKIHIVIYDNGNIYYSCQHGSVTGTYALTELSVASSRKTYTVSDTFITANTSVKMYLTDEGGVKSYSKANGSITVIRDAVPTTAIPYEYEVEQTSAEGLFEVINAYVPNVPTKTSDLTNDSGFVKPTEANTFTAEQTFSNENGIKTNRVHNLNGNAWYDFDGTNDRLGSLATPTIIRTSEARPKAEVPSGSATVTKELALLEDIPATAAWIDTNDERVATLTQAGTYQVLAETIFQDNGVDKTHKFYVEIYFDGTNETDGTSSTWHSYNTETSVLAMRTLTPTIRNGTNGEKLLHAEFLTYAIGASPVTATTNYIAFKYRKIN